MDVKRERLPVSAFHRHRSRSVSFHVGPQTVLILDPSCCWWAEFLPFTQRIVAILPPPLLLTSVASYVNMNRARLAEGGLFLLQL